jgi:hypothetical protein
MSSCTQLIQTFNNINNKRNSVEYLNKVAGFDEKAISDILTIKRIETQYTLLNKIYTSDEEMHKINNEVNDTDKLSIIMNLDEDTKDYVLESMKCSLKRAEHTLSFFWSLKCLVNTLIIVNDIYSHPIEKELIEEMKDLNIKLVSRINIYDFWKNISTSQRQKLLDWYNSQKPEDMIAHPMNLNRNENIINLD